MDNIINYIVLPSNIILWLIISAILLYFFSHKEKSIYVGVFSLVLFFILSCGPGSQFLLSSLEYQYPEYDQTEHRDTNIKSIVLLTGSADPKPDTPLSSQVNHSSAHRVLETRRLYTLQPDSMIYISGYKNVPEILKQLLVKMDVPEDVIKIETQSTNTYLNAKNLAGFLKDDPFILVTSAGHMPRAMAVFKKQGLSPIPAPTEFKSWKNIFTVEYLPTPKHLINSDLAMHEYLGILWYKITGKI